MKTSEIAEFIGGELVGDGDVEIVRVASLDAAATGEIAFVEISEALSAAAACLICSQILTNSLLRFGGDSPSSGRSGS